MIVAPLGNIFTIRSPCASPPLTLSAPTCARMPSTFATRRSTVTTGTLASTACCSAGASASTSFGLITMPFTPLVSAASTSAVCFGDETCPSLSITSSPCFWASALKAFIMCTKNGKVRPGTEARIWSAAWALKDIVAARATTQDASFFAVKTRIEMSPLVLCVVSLRCLRRRRARQKPSTRQPARTVTPSLEAVYCAPSGLVSRRGTVAPLCMKANARHDVPISAARRAHRLRLLCAESPACLARDRRRAAGRGVRSRRGQGAQGECRFRHTTRVCRRGRPVRERAARLRRHRHHDAESSRAGRTRGAASRADHRAEALRTDVGRLPRDGGGVPAGGCAADGARELPLPDADAGAAARAAFRRDRHTHVWPRVVSHRL